MISLKSKREIAIIQDAAEILKQIFVEVKPAVQPGVSTEELDRIAENVICKRGARPAFKGYRGFPKTACISLNEEVVHGIPSKRILKEGDIISVDIGCQLEGYFADAARTWPVGRITSSQMRLVETAQLSFESGVSVYKSGCRLGDISAGIQKCIEERGYQVIRDYVGHGIGRNLHEDPQVPNYGKAGHGIKIEEGLVLAIEPMVAEGHWKVKVLQDGWTVVTADGKLSSHYEDTVVFMDGKVVNLTA